MSKPETWKSWAGRVVDGKFPLRQYLGGSDHSAVFLTELPGPRSGRAAIKLIEPKGADIEGELSRLGASASLSHPHLIRTLETGRCQMDGGLVLYVVMECADDDLAQILPQRALEPNEVADLLPPVLDALSYLHGKGFVHGRITPSNVLAVGEQLKLSADNVYVASKAESTRRRIDAYDAPETAAGIVLPEGDIWSVGALLVAALTQNVALAEDGSGNKSGLPQNIPEPFRGIARECLHLDPKRRCSLPQIQARLQPPARSVPEPEPGPVPPVRHYRYSWRMLIPIAVVLVFGLVWGIYRRLFSASPATTGTVNIQISEPPKAANPAPVEAAAPVAAKAQASPGAVLHQVLPEIPRSAQDTISGTIKVAVRVEVDSAGKVTSAKFKSAGSSKYFARQALQAAEHWEFSAPEVNGQPTASTWLLQFRFKRTSMQATSQRVAR
jgi:TonB family protein